MTPILSPRTNLRFLKTRAKALLKAHAQKDPKSLDVLRHLRRFSKATAAEIFDSDLGLSDVQYALALQHGFKSWNDLRKAVLAADKLRNGVETGKGGTMKSVVIRNKTEVKLGVTGVSEEVQKRLLEDYYTELDGAFVRTYPADTPGMDGIIASFEKSGASYFSQVYGNEPVQWQEALSAFLNRVKGLDMKWLLTGSCAVAVHGLDLKPRGVDLVMRMKDLEKVRELLADATIIPFEECKDWVCLGYGMAFLNAPLGIGFEPQEILDRKKPSDSGPYAMAHAETVMWKGYPVRVPPLELLLNINKARGRNERAALIEGFMALRQAAL